MNIFMTDACPVQSALWLDDKRVVKMALESTQLLSNAMGGPYKPTHQNHPCSVWAAEDGRNYAWLWRHAVELCFIYARIYGRHHACIHVLNEMPEPIGWEPPRFGVNCAAHAGLGLNFKHLPVVTAYRKYLRARWKTDKRQPTWQGRPEPPWL